MVELGGGSVKGDESGSAKELGSPWVLPIFNRWWCGSSFPPVKQPCSWCLRPGLTLHLLDPPYFWDTRLSALRPGPILLGNRGEEGRSFDASALRDWLQVRLGQSFLLSPSITLRLKCFPKNVDSCCQDFSLSPQASAKNSFFSQQIN